MFSPNSVQDIAQNRQQHFCGHDNDVTSFACHPSKQLIASGQSVTTRSANRQPKICLWKIENGSPNHSDIVTIEDFHQRSVNHLEFDVSGRYLISVGGDDDNSLALYDCNDSKKPQLVTTAAASKAKVVGTCGFISSSISSSLIII